MKDKRIECGCHKDCSMLEHVCDKPCKWPNCLTKDETEALISEMARPDKYISGPMLKCFICGYECFFSDQYEFHEILQGEWRFVCWADVRDLELNEGK